jgi:hypothetical protein
LEALLAVTQPGLGGFAVRDILEGGEYAGLTFKLEAGQRGEQIPGVAGAGSEGQIGVHDGRLGVEVLKESKALLGVGPEGEIGGGVVDDVVAGVTAELEEALVDFQEPILGWAGDGQGDGAGAEGFGEEAEGISPRGVPGFSELFLA